MKYLFFATVTSILLTSCDTPQRTRATTSLNGDALQTASGAGPGLTDVSAGGAASGATGGTTGGTTTDPNFPTCDLSLKYSTADLGQIGLCQSTVNETMFKFKSSLTSDSRVCLIPTYKDTSGASTWLGQPQCTMTTAGSTYSGSLYKTRSGYTGYSINGVMVMKEGLLTEYFQCIDAYINYINTYCPLNPNNTQCVNNANLQRNYLCNNFKTKYPNNYLDIRVR